MDEFMNEKNIIFLLKEDVMKKLLVLALVLSVASLASASVQMSLQVNGQDADAITLMPSDFVTISIVGDITPLDGTGAWLLVAGPGTLVGGDISHVANETMVDVVLGNEIDPENPGQTWGQFFDTLYPGTNRAIDLVWVDSESPFVGFGPGLFGEAVFHCDAPGDVTIAIVDYAGEELLVRDTLVITQLPEPMTMVLLGLGGLFLRRRK
jgi:hypothetical protein